MSGLLKNKWLSGAFVGVVLLCGVYYFYSSGDSSATLTDNSAVTSPLSQTILTTLGALRTITLDPQLFKDPVFVSLTDFGVTIPPQQAGRRNPFAPLDSSASSNTTDTTKKTTTP